MTSRVRQFLSESGGNNFTETAPRPPVPGEENEIQSNGGVSTRSSESHKSNKSCKSGGSTREIAAHSPAATPRRSMKDKSLIFNQSCCVDDDDMTAPLGFEPEGSVSNSPPFTENSTPPYMKWAENLNYLLEDRDGVQLFKQFLENEDFQVYSVDFYFACEGLKKKPAEDVNNITSIIKAIHKKFIKTDKLPFITERTKTLILEKLQKKNVADQGIFDNAQKEVQEHMRKNTYPLFLKSDLFVQYIQKEGESPKSTSTSGSNSVRPTSGPLPTLPEDQELHNVLTSDIDGPPSASKNRNSDMMKRTVNEPFNFTCPTVPRVPLPHTYQSYAPTSLQDSEIQSISSASDALTDDTRSQTDSSIDGDPKMIRRMRRKMRLKAEQNKESHFNQPFIPRTHRQPKDRNIAETNPQAFAEMLIDKLRKVEQKQEKDERLRASMSRVFDESDVDNPMNHSMSFTQNTTTSSSVLQPLMTSTVIDEENADSILEEHCSRIWESSAQQTPSRSPGRHSPTNTKPKSPDRSKKNLLQSLPPSRLVHHKKRPDYHTSFDSGMGEEKGSNIETHRHIHHHHHHHHPKGCKSQLESDTQRLFHGSDRGRGNRKYSDTGSNIDSGVSMIESIPSMPNMRDPSCEKVLTWMMESDRMGSSNTADSDKASSQKRVRSTSSSTPAPRKPVSKKTGHGSSRSASMDRSGFPTPTSGAMPSQPFIQDPSMPVNQPPSTTVQLEEAKRRLEESRTAPPVKSKSFGGIAATKDKKPSMTSQGNIRPSMPSARTVPSDLDMSFDSYAGADRKKKSPVSSANTSGSTGEEVIIGYYFCSEPIPYKITVPGNNVTLSQFKQLIGRVGNYRYFFKKKSNEFGEEGAVYEEVKHDIEVLPLYDGRIIAKVTKND